MSKRKSMPLWASGCGRPAVVPSPRETSLFCNPPQRDVVAVLSAAVSPARRRDATRVHQEIVGGRASLAAHKTLQSPRTFPPGPFETSHRTQ
jgi:hypothetical protein